MVGFGQKAGYKIYSRELTGLPSRPRFFHLKSCIPRGFVRTFENRIWCMFYYILYKNMTQNQMERIRDKVRLKHQAGLNNEDILRELPHLIPCCTSLRGLRISLVIRGL